MLCLAIFILQSTLTYTSVTLPHVTYHWKTTEYFDKVDDYWNHGPIYIPGLQYVFTLTTKASDIFPPWLTRSTTHSTEPIKHATPESVTPFITTTTPVESSETKIQSIVLNISIIAESTDKSKTIDDTVEMDKTTAKTEPKATTITITTQHITPKIQLSESEEDGTTDPFSVFLRKLFRNLSVKSLPELPALVEPFLKYSEELANGQLKYLGDVIIPFVKKFGRDVRKIITTAPDVLHARVYQIYNALSIRDAALDADVLGLLNVLDDTFDEAEEEFMQSTLHDVKRFPNSNKTAQEIAHDLLDNIILATIRRINGTSKGVTVYLMVKDILEKENRRSDVRRNLKKISGHLRAYDKANSDIDNINNPIHKYDISSSDIKHYRAHRKKISVNNRRDEKTRADASLKKSQAIYQTVRNNLEDIRYLMDKVVISSSETNEYELSVDSESEDKVRSVPEQTDNIHFRYNEERDLSLENIDETLLSPLRHSHGRTKHQKHLRNHRHRHRHKKHRHKHGHKHKHSQGKRKYKNLKRKYERLKEILASQDRSRPEKNKKHIDINMKQADMKNLYPKSADISKKSAVGIDHSPSVVTKTAMKGNHRFKIVDSFLNNNNSDAKVKNNNNRQLKILDEYVIGLSDIDNTESYTVRNYGILRKAIPRNTTVVFDGNDSSEAEKELKKKIHDTIGHMH